MVDQITIIATPQNVRVYLLSGQPELDALLHQFEIAPGTVEEMTTWVREFLGVEFHKAPIEVITYV